MPRGNLIAIALAVLGVVILGGFYLMTRPGPSTDPAVVTETETAPETGTDQATETGTETPATAAGAEVPGDPPGPYITITVDGQFTDGQITIDLLQDVAPNHVAQITQLARDGFYDGVYFHRVIDGFMAQTGDGQFGKVGADPRRAGTGGSELPDLEAEFSDVPFERGIVGLARSQSPDSAHSPFFIMFDEGAFLNGQYTVVGRVTEGLDVLDDIKRGDGSTLQVTGEPDRMVNVVVSE